MIWHRQVYCKTSKRPVRPRGWPTYQAMQRTTDHLTSPKSHYAANSLTARQIPPTLERCYLLCDHFHNSPLSLCWRYSSVYKIIRSVQVESSFMFIDKLKSYLVQTSVTIDVKLAASESSRLGAEILFLIIKYFTIMLTFEGITLTTILTSRCPLHFKSTTLFSWEIKICNQNTWLSFVLSDNFQIRRYREYGFLRLFPNLVLPNLAGKCNSFLRDCLREQAILGYFQAKDLSTFSTLSSNSI